MERRERAFSLTPMRRSESQRVAQEIAAMSRHQIEQGLGWSWRSQRILRQLRRPDTIVLIAHREKQLLGFGMMRYATLQAHLLLLAVKPEAQRMGIGTALLQWLEDCARTGGCAQAILEVVSTNAQARAFYTSLGYHVWQRLPGYYQGRIAALRLRKALHRHQAPSQAADIAPVSPGDTSTPAKGAHPTNDPRSALATTVANTVDSHRLNGSGSSPGHRLDGSGSRLAQIATTADSTIDTRLAAQKIQIAQQRQSFGAQLTGAERLIWKERMDTTQPTSLFVMRERHGLTPQEIQSTEKALAMRWREHLVHRHPREGGERLKPTTPP